VAPEPGKRRRANPDGLHWHACLCQPRAVRFPWSNPNRYAFRHLFVRRYVFGICFLVAFLSLAARWRRFTQGTRSTYPLNKLKGLHVPTRVIALLKLMLAPDLKDRPQSARELLSAIYRCYAKYSAEARFASETIHPGCGRGDLTRPGNCIGEPGYINASVLPQRWNDRSRFLPFRKSQCEWRRYLFHRGNAG